jgi:predicted alpha/beta hydrolase family esterase
LVECSKEPIAGLFLAAPFVGALGLPDYDQINASFFATSFDWPSIRRRKGDVCKCWAGDDDPYVPLTCSQEVAHKLGTELEVVAGGGHLNSETGFNKFPQLRDFILRNQAQFTISDSSRLM